MNFIHPRPNPSLVSPAGKQGGMVVAASACACSPDRERGRHARRQVSIPPKEHRALDMAGPIKIGVVILFVVMTLIVNLQLSFGLEYYVSNSGEDNNEGTSPSKPWQTLNKVNSFQFSPNDVVCFQRGSVWRQPLLPCSGSEKGCIRYSSYGQGEKPLLLGSVEKNNPKEWKNEGNNVWSTFLRQGLDVGNIIFDNGKGCGIKVWEELNLNRQNEFWYDDSGHILEMYSSRNPAEMFKDIECALTRPIINISNKEYIIFEGLQVAYGGAHGISGESTYRITIRDCDIYFVGGGCQYGKIKNGQKVRFGNGIEFWNNARDNIVENCRLWDIYDAGITNQGRTSGNIQSNIIYRNNKIWNCEYSFEYWNSPETSTTRDIYFENNVCLNAGYGWSHNQRPDPSGRHLCFFTNTAKTSNIYIRNNTFDNAVQSCIWFCPSGRSGAPGFNGIEAIIIDYNTYFQPNNKAIIFWGAKIYYPDDFAAYQRDTDKDSHSK